MRLAPGEMVTDKVRLEKPLGEGGMGAVWVAQHLSLEMRVAAKFIHADLAASNPDLVTRFEREAKIAAQIRSPHVVQVFDNGVTSDGTPYIVMEMLHGNSLAEWLALEGCLDVRSVARIVSQVASVLHKAHRLGIVHRDIKPDNIFMVEDEDDLFIKVLDFGIAKATTTPKDKRMTAVGAVIGTPLYMSPEQAQSSKEGGSSRRSRAGSTTVGQPASTASLCRPSPATEVSVSRRRARWPKRFSRSLQWARHLLKSSAHR